MPPRPLPTPIGFLMLGMVLAVPAFYAGALLAGSGPGPLGRILLAIVAVLSLVMIEALWWVRPWLGRAVDAWAAGCTIVVLVAGASAMGRSWIMPMAVLAICFVGVPCALVRWYVRDHAGRLGVLP
jgi:hypothetical protein